MDRPTPPTTGRKLKRRLVTKSAYYEDYYGIRNPDEDPHPGHCETESDSEEELRTTKTSRRHLPGFFKQFHPSKTTNAESLDTDSEPKREKSKAGVLEAAPAPYYKTKAPGDLPSPSPTPFSGFHKLPSRKLTPKKGGMFSNIYKHGVDRGDEAPHAHTKTTTTTLPTSSTNQQAPTIETANGQISRDDLEGDYRYPHRNFQPQPLPHYRLSSAFEEDPSLDFHSYVAGERAQAISDPNERMLDTDNETRFVNSAQRNQSSLEADDQLHETTPRSGMSIREKLKKMREDNRLRLESRDAASQSFTQAKATPRSIRDQLEKMREYNRARRLQAAEQPSARSSKQRVEYDRSESLEDESDTDSLLTRVPQSVSQGRLEKLRQENEARLSQFIGSTAEGSATEEWVEDIPQTAAEMSDSPPSVYDNGALGVRRGRYKGRPRDLQIPELADMEQSTVGFPSANGRIHQTRLKRPYRPLPRSPDKLQRSWRFAGGDGVTKKFGKKKMERAVRERVEQKGRVLVMKEVRIPLAVERKVERASQNVVDLTDDFEHPQPGQTAAGHRFTAMVVIDNAKDLGGTLATRTKARLDGTVAGLTEGDGRAPKASTRSGRCYGRGRGHEGSRRR